MRFWLLPSNGGRWRKLTQRLDRCGVLAQTDIAATAPKTTAIARPTESLFEGIMVASQVGSPELRAIAILASYSRPPPVFSDAPSAPVMAARTRRGSKLSEAISQSMNSSYPDPQQFLQYSRVATDCCQ